MREQTPRVPFRQGAHLFKLGSDAIWRVGAQADHFVIPMPVNRRFVFAKLL